MEMHGRRGSRNTLLAGLHVRGDTGTFGELNTYAGYTPPGNNRVVYHSTAPLTPWGRYTPPEITGLYTIANELFCGLEGIYHPEITPLHTI